MVIFWVIVALSVAVTNFAEVAMKIQVNEKLQPQEQLPWRKVDFRKVTRKHEELYPDSWLPLIAQGSFWLCVGLGTMARVYFHWVSK
jgi:hypothetical protein